MRYQPVAGDVPSPSQIPLAKQFPPGLCPDAASPPKKLNRRNLKNTPCGLVAESEGTFIVTCWNEKNRNHSLHSFEQKNELTSKKSAKIRRNPRIRLADEDVRRPGVSCPARAGS